MIRKVQLKNHMNKLQVINDNHKDILDIISRRKWIFAKTMPQNPHFYTVKNLKDKNDCKDYEYLYKYIFNNHYIERYNGWDYKYCVIGNYIYWIMTDFIEESIIINRREKNA